MSGHKQIVQELLTLCGVTVNGPNPWDIRVNDDSMYARVLRDQSLGLGESYVDGWWDCPRVDELIFRILTARLDQKVKGSLRLLVPFVQSLLFNRQYRRRY